MLYILLILKQIADSVTSVGYREYKRKGCLLFISMYGVLKE